MTLHFAGPWTAWVLYLGGATGIALSIAFLAALILATRDALAAKADAGGDHTNSVSFKLHNGGR